MITFSGTLTGLTNKKWIKANYKMTGFFRVTYSEDNWKLLIKQLDTNHTVRYHLRFYISNGKLSLISNDKLIG